MAKKQTSYELGHLERDILMIISGIKSTNPWFREAKAIAEALNRHGREYVDQASVQTSINNLIVQKKFIDMNMELTELGLEVLAKETKILMNLMKTANIFTEIAIVKVG